MMSDHTALSAARNHLVDALKVLLQAGIMGVNDFGDSVVHVEAAVRSLRPLIVPELGKCVYLCGPINGRSDDDCTGWREYAKTKLLLWSTKDPMARDIVTDWRPYYEWVEPLIQSACDWAVIPDEIDGGSQVQDYLVSQWPFGQRGAPVWHMDEPIHRLQRLCDEHPRVCIGSTGEYAWVGSDDWRTRMDETFEVLIQGRRFLPWLHMLRV